MPDINGLSLAELRDLKESALQVISQEGAKSGPDSAGSLAKIDEAYELLKRVEPRIRELEEKLDADRT